MHVLAGILAFFGLSAAPPPHHSPPPPKTFLVRETELADEKAVFATVQPTNIVPARARIAGTVVELKVKWGDHVDEGQVIAIVGDPKLALQINSYNAAVNADRAQAAEAKVEYERAERLIGQGAISRNAYDQARTAYNVAVSNVNAMIAQEAVTVQQRKEGQVLAPIAGRIITVPVTTGTVAMAGDTVATVAEQNFVVRLDVPERHALYLKVGAPVRLDGADLGGGTPRYGRIVLIYPQVESGHVVADATVEGLEDYFVGRRVRVWVSAGTRQTIVVPSDLITTRFGIDYARLWTRADGSFDVPVQRGELLPRLEMPDGIEILSGLKPGDRLLHP